MSSSTKPKTTSRRRKTKAQRLREDFKYFLYCAWKFLGLPPPTDVQYDIADYLQHGPRRKVIEAFRGVGKSWITSAYVVWRLYCDPQKKFLVVSASKPRADDFSTFTKRLISEWAILAHLQAREGQRDAGVAFDVGPATPAHAPSVKSVGVTGQLTGSRAHEIIADDVESANNSQTQTMREKLAETIKEFEAILTPGGTITFLGTPQTEESIYNLLPTRGYEMRIWPARYPHQKQREAYGPRLAPLLTNRIENSPDLASACDGRGDTTDPKRFSDLDLVERAASYGSAGWLLQFMLDTSLSDAERYPLKLGNLIVMDTDPEIAPTRLTWAADPRCEWEGLPNVGFTGDRFYRPAFVAESYAPYQGSAMYIDPAGRGSDETGYALAKMLHGRIFIRKWGGLAGGFDPETLLFLAQAAKDEQVNMIYIEKNFGGGMFTELFRPYLIKVGHNVTLEEVHSTGQKEKRVLDVLEPLFNQHRLVMERTLILADQESTKHYPEQNRLMYQGFHQMTRLTRDRGCLKHDDRIEALAGVCAPWVAQIGISDEAAEDRYKERKLQEELKKFKRHAYGMGDSPGRGNRMVITPHRRMRSGI